MSVPQESMPQMPRDGEDRRNPDVHTMPYSGTERRALWLISSVEDGSLEVPAVGSKIMEHPKLELVETRERVAAIFEIDTPQPEQALSSDLVDYQRPLTISPTEPTDIAGQTNSSASRIRKWVDRVRTTTERPKHEPKFSLRMATSADIDDIVSVDMRSFDSVYRNYAEDDAELREELREKFSNRLEKVGSEWMPVLERDGKIVGFMTCCPTSKTPEEFESWEKTTDDGTLDSTYDPNGKNVYVVTLSVLSRGAAGKDMLYAHQIGKMMREGYDQGFFESRLPGLRKWVERSVKKDGIDINSLTPEAVDWYAQQYFELRTTDKKGRSVPQDPLIRLYDRIGCKFLKVAPDAYRDEQSMNHGVVCVYDGKQLFDGSILPIRLPENKFTRWMFGAIMQGTTRIPAFSKFLFK